MGAGQFSLPQSFRSRLAFELDTPTDPEKLLIGTRWRLESFSPGAANDVEFRANGTLRFSKQCGTWIYRVASKNKLEIQQKDTCSLRFSPSPFDLRSYASPSPPIASPSIFSTSRTAASQITEGIAECSMFRSDDRNSNVRRQILLCSHQTGRGSALFRNTRAHHLGYAIDVVS